jgi:hypothetical protein
MLLNGTKGMTSAILARCLAGIAGSRFRNCDRSLHLLSNRNPLVDDVTKRSREGGLIKR